MALTTGDVFYSFQDFEAALKAFQASNHVLFRTKSSQKLWYHPDAERLKYIFLHYECKHGKKRPTSSKGMRPKQSTVKCNCEAYIRISTFETDGKSALKITGANHHHKNHPVDAMTASIYPENRRKRRKIDRTVETNSGHDVPPIDDMITTDETDTKTVLTDETTAKTVLTDETAAKTVQTMTLPDSVTSTVDLPHDQPDCSTARRNSVAVVESFCHKCGKKELDRSLHVNGVVERVRCTECPRSFHKYCLGSNIRVSRAFVCSFCLPGVIARMKDMLSDYMHNASVMSDGKKV